MRILTRSQASLEKSLDPMLGSIWVSGSGMNTAPTVSLHRYLGRLCRVQGIDLHQISFTEAFTRNPCLPSASVFM